MPRAFLFCAILVAAACPLSASVNDSLLWEGLSAYRAGEYAAALPLLGNRNDNPYLETFRLSCRADCLMRDSLYREAAAAIETLFALVDAGEVVREHRRVVQARDLYFEALARANLCVSDPVALFSSKIPSGMGEPSPRALLFASLACLAAGDSAKALDYFVNGANAHPVHTDTAIFGELFRRCEPLIMRSPDRALLEIAARAADLGLLAEANAAASRALARNAGDPDALLCRAHVLSRSGEQERALRVYWGVFSSGAPVRAKASALIRIASLEYHLKRYDDAAKHYRMFGMYYPSEEQAPRSLDTAARIHVMRGEWKRALHTWSVLRERHRHRAPVEAGLSESVLRSWLGDDTRAHAILREILPRAARPHAAAVLFWLMKTSASDEERATWSDSLLRAWPRSFYASLQEGKESEILRRMLDPDARRFDALLRRVESRRAAYGEAEADSGFMRLPAPRAYFELLERDFCDEARVTARAMFKMKHELHESDSRAGSPHAGSKDSGAPRFEERLFKLYGEAARKGCEALALEIAFRTPATDTSRLFPLALRYPVSFTEEIRGASDAGLSPFLVLAVIREESAFDPNAVSRAGAVGLMQLLPSTAAWHASVSGAQRLKGGDLRDPAENIRAGTAYLRYLLERYGESVVGAIAAYNAGESRMARWRESFKPGDNPLVALELIGPRETRSYVRRVLDSFASYAAMGSEEACEE